MCHLTEGDMGRHSTCDAPSLCWCLCYCLAGVFACIALASLPSLCWGLCPCCAVIFVLLVLAGVSTVVALALSPLLQWHHCHCCTGVFAGVWHWHQSPSLRWRLHHRFAGIVTQSPHCSGVFSIVPLALSPSLCCLCL